MTENQLAGLYTPPDPKLALVRRILLTVLEDRIQSANRQLQGAIGTGHKWGLVNYRNGLVEARRTIADCVGQDGKILKLDLAQMDLLPEELQLLTDEQDNQDQQAKQDKA